MSTNSYHDKSSKLCSMNPTSKEFYELVVNCLFISLTELSEQLLQLQISSASLARKQQNYNLAEQLILDQSELLLQVFMNSVQN